MIPSSGPAGLLPTGSSFAGMGVGCAVTEERKLLVHDQRLYNSVQRLLDDGEKAQHVAHMFTRHHLAFPFIGFAAVAVGIVAILAGVGDWPSRISLGLAGAAVAAMATTEYRVLARTSRGLVLLASSRLRRRAIRVMKRLPGSTSIRPVGSNLVITDFEVGNVTYSVMRRYQEEMTAIADS